MKNNGVIGDSVGTSNRSAVFAPEKTTNRSPVKALLVSAVVIGAGAFVAMWAMS
ncbi:Uncharacterised protein [BD1-7 clade bacterium]|uniref:Uncharacterized protein n=1 Tax=BD1-7 clade bacterium TaxID=2029982 RepID=A0A5S9NLA2_9GAMM|nr:Uncharacterised protein [BD1-7 clade bacterium]CAA0094112.1 Uncharacterised protein [BD1-7 clade bacterium]